MNKNIQKINIEDCLFFDIETVSRNEELTLDSREYELWRWKQRNRDTDEYLEPKELQEVYKKRAALTIGFNRIVTIGVGYVKDGEIRIKALQGTEEEILQEFAKITNHFKYFVGFNVLYFDLPIINANSQKYFNIVESMNPSAIVSGEKPWGMKNVIDLMDTVKGTHFYNPSFDECCYMYDIPSPKQGLQGSEVTQTYYSKGIEPILDYVSKDVFALVNLFQAVRWEPRFEDYIDSTENLKPKSVVEQLFQSKELNAGTKEELQKLLQKKRISKKDKEVLKDILFSLILRSDFDAKDSKEEIQRKQEEVEQFLSEL